MIEFNIDAMKHFFTFLCLYCTGFACSPAKQAMKSPFQQGIRGYVGEVTGNQMPSPDIKPAPPKGIRTTVYIYELTNINQTERVGTSPFYKNIHTAFVQSVKSDSTGYFMASLPVGKYSVFTKVKGQFYSNNFDASNNISAIEVIKGKVTDVNIKLSANAIF